MQEKKKLNFYGCYFFSCTKNMTVKNLIHHLKKCNPNAEVRVGSCCGTIDGIVQEVSADVLSPANTHCVYIACKITHYNGTKVGERVVREEIDVDNLILHQ